MVPKTIVITISLLMFSSALLAGVDPNVANWYAVIGIFQSQSEARKFAEQFRSVGYEVGIYETDENNIAVTLGRRMTYKECIRVLDLAEEKEIGKPYLWQSDSWTELSIIVQKANIGNKDITELLRSVGYEDKLRKLIAGTEVNANLRRAFVNRTTNEITMNIFIQSIRIERIPFPVVIYNRTDEMTLLGKLTTNCRLKSDGMVVRGSGGLVNHGELIALTIDMMDSISHQICE